MGLQRQGAERGYAMAALLVALAVMSVLMSAALPAWRHQARREKEAELVFRGEQYARAVGLYQKKNGPGTFPPSVDILVQQRFLRKKFKDPITDDDFFLIQAGAPTAPGQTGSLAGGSQPPGSQPTRPGGPTATVVGPGGATATRGGAPSGAVGSGMQPGGRPGGGQVQGVGGGIMGVSSKSKDTSILIYKGRTHYNEWTFLFANANARPGGAGSQRPGIPPGVRAPTGPGGIGGGLGGGRGGQPRPGGPGQSGRPGGLSQPTIRPPGL